MKLKFTTSLPALAVVLALASCGGKASDFPMEKPHWGADEYNRAIHQIKYLTPEGEKYPTLDDPETAPIFRQLVNRENITVVTDDPSLGVRFKAQYTSGIFEQYRDIASVYRSQMDREDHYVYDRELAEILKFGAFLQVHYFKLGNEVLIAESDETESAASTVRLNEKTLLTNYNVLLDYVDKEKSFSESALEVYIEAINEEFELLEKYFPNAPYGVVTPKAEAMLQKATSPALKTALENLVAKLKARTSAPTP